MSELEAFDYKPVYQDINLGLNATNATVSMGLFSYVTQIIITFQMTDAAIEWTEFLAGGALSNGLYITLDDEQITPTAKTKGELCEWGEAYISPADNDSCYVIQVVLDFTKWCGNLGLQVASRTKDRSLVFDINDDLSSVTNLITANVKGWKVV